MIRCVNSISKQMFLMWFQPKEMSMAHLSLPLSTMETPIERIFERVMLRKMTEDEKEALGLTAPFKPKKQLPGLRTSLARKSSAGLRS